MIRNKNDVNLEDDKNSSGVNTQKFHKISKNFRKIEKFLRKIDKSLVFWQLIAN